MDEFLSREEIEFEVEEIKVVLPSGGYIAGKWWGDKSIRPFVCLHGWLDNAGTFDKLIPLLPKNYSYLAIDFPGHGKSSWLPPGVPYHNYDFLHVLSYVMKEYNWNKISLICHSMGGGIAFLYAVLFPDKVDVLVTIDAVGMRARNSSNVLDNLRESIDNFMIADERNQEKSEPPAYSIDEMVEKLHNNSNGGISRDAAPCLLKRNIRPSKKFPGKFCFTYDNRMKYNIGFNLSEEIFLDMAREIKAPYLFIKASDTYLPFPTPFFAKLLNIFKELTSFEYAKIDSKAHHLHLSEPEKIAGMVSEFIEKHRKVQSQL